MVILGKENSLLSQFIAEIRHHEIQKDRMRFRKNMERLGEIFAYEVSKRLAFTHEETITPLGIAASSVLKDQPVVAAILRAALPFHQGMLNFFDKADNAFVSAYRKPHKNGEFDVSVEYVSSSSLKGKTLILGDPMLATGSSVVLAYRALIEKGKPAHTHICTVIASAQGIEYVKQNMPEEITIWVGAVDQELTAQAYIVPGLGDAGDLAFGEKGII